MIAHDDRREMLAVPLCGERVLARLEWIGFRGLSDLRNRDPCDVMHENNLQARRTIGRTPIALLALENLIDAARRRRG